MSKFKITGPVTWIQEKTHWKWRCCLHKPTLVWPQSGALASPWPEGRDGLSLRHMPYSPSGRDRRVETHPSHFLPCLLTMSSSFSQTGATGEKTGTNQGSSGKVQVFTDTDQTQEDLCQTLVKAVQPGDQPTSRRCGGRLAVPGAGKRCYIFTFTAPSQDQMEPKRVITLKPFMSQPLPLRPIVITALAATRHPPARRTEKCASTVPPEHQGITHPKPLPVSLTGPTAQLSLLRACSSAEAGTCSP